MPVQINELVIKAHIAEPAGKAKQAAPGPVVPPIDKQELIRECTEVILELLHRKKER